DYFVARFEHRRAVGKKRRAVADNHSDRAFWRQIQATERLAQCATARIDDGLDHLDIRVAQAQQRDEIRLWNLLFEHGQHDLRRVDRRVDAEHAKQVLVARIIDPRNRAARAEATFGYLQQNQVAWVVAGDGNDHVRAFGASFGEGTGFVGVAAQHYVAEFVGNELGPIGVVFDDQDFMAVLDQFARQEEAYFATARDNRVHPPESLYRQRGSRLAGQLLIERIGADNR